MADHPRRLVSLGAVGAAVLAGLLSSGAALGAQPQGDSTPGVFSFPCIGQLHFD